MLSALGAFAVTIGLILVALPVLRRLQSAGARSCAVRLEMIGRLPTGSQQSVGLVRVGDRVLVLSLAEGGATLLTELSGDALTTALAAAPTGIERATTTPSFVAPWTGARDVAKRLGLGALMPMVATIALVMCSLVAPLEGQQPAGGQHTPSTSPAKGGAPSSTVVNVAPYSPAPGKPSLPTQAGPQPLRPPVVEGPDSPKIDFRIGEGAEQVKLTGSVGLVIFMGALTLLPAMFLLMTSFTRILIVLHFLRSAIGTQTAPPGQLLVALAVLLTGMVMHPVMERANTEAIQPYLKGQVTQVKAYETALTPFREFMLANTRDQDLASFAEMSGAEDADSLEALPTVTIVSAFVTSELRTAFQMGFVIFLPFVVVDLIVASVLMSMGMFMLPPAMVSLPFKLLLFVLADGWTLVVRNLVASFHGVPA